MSNTQNLSDEEIVRYVCQKDKELYSEIIKRYQQKLLRYVNYLVGESSLAEDIVQETFIKAYVNLNSFNLKKKFSSWIYRIAHNEAMNNLTKNKKKVSLNSIFDFDSGINVEDEFSKKEIQAMVHKCLGEMPAHYKEPLVLYFLEGKSYEEISDILRLAIGTVGTRINRAKVLMKKICQTKK